MNVDALPVKSLVTLLEDAAGRDEATARRAELVGILLDERYLTREQLARRVESRLGRGCFGGAAWEDTFYRDMRVVKKAMRAGGYRLKYSRAAGQAGYYLEGLPPLSPAYAELLRQSAAEVDPVQVGIFRQMSPAGRFQLGCSVTDAACQVVAYRLRQRHPQLSLPEASFLALQGRLPG